MGVAAALIVYVVASYGLAWRFRGRIETSEDYLVAGRRLPLPLATATLLATWFGAGTLLTAADEVRHQGLRAIALEPLGAGLCLILAGLFLARPLWAMKLSTLGDFFAQRYGPRVEAWASVVMVPGYFGWIAVQLVALAEVLELMVGLPVGYGVALVAAISMGYTLLGGMWAVTITDAVQLSLLLVGLVGLTVQVGLHLGGGDLGQATASLRALPAEALTVVPRDQWLGWLGVLAVASLGNLPGQDLTQRIFAAKSADTARRACLLAGLGYLTFGAMPVMLGLSARLLAPADDSIVVALARAFMSPATTTVFVVAIAGAVLSTIDSAILAPAGVLARNVITPRLTAGAIDPLRLDRACVVGVTVASLVVAYAGQSAYTLLEEAYGLGLMALFVPLVAALRGPGCSPAALAAIAVGFTSWALHLAAGWDHFVQPLSPLALPPPLVTALLAAVVYGVVARIIRARTRGSR